jgi:hypothetical protein
VTGQHPPYSGPRSGPRPPVSPPRRQPPVGASTPQVQRVARALSQYFGPTNSSIRATDSRRATDSTFRRAIRQRTPS